MTQKQVEQAKLWHKQQLEKIPYRMVYWDKFDYTILSHISYEKRRGRGNNASYNNIIIMADTETSKKKPTTYNKKEQKYNTGHNHICAFTISLRANKKNIATLYGTRPSELVECIKRIHFALKGDKTIFYWHNLAYDWVFVRQFMFGLFGLPDKQLNTKPHYPINIEWENGIIFKDSLILAQRKLEKWALDLDVEHKKAVGKWDYNKIRHQSKNKFTQDELEYIENDTLAGVECIDKMLEQLNKRIYAMPYTATGIIREEARKRGKQFHARDFFLRTAPTLEQYIKLTAVYHGGYTHANRHLLNTVINWDEIIAYDFSSSYPAVMVTKKYPMEKFTPLRNCSLTEIEQMSNEYAFMFKLVLVKPRLKDDFTPMPVLQYSKTITAVNPIQDNGRILCASYIEIYTNEIDARLIAEQYDFESHICIEVEVAHKDYMPRWFTDYVYELYKAKCELKKVHDPVLMSIIKSKINSLYGMLCQRSIRENIKEDYLTGEYETMEQNPVEDYQKFLDNNNSIFLYQLGVWVTSYAMENLHTLGKLCDTWIYSDTDSVYGIGWDEKGIEAYNNKCKNEMLANGYEPVVVDSVEYVLGKAELDSISSEFVTVGAKRYCKRDKKDGQLHITVAGVPKNGAEQLKDISDFKKGFIFDGVTSGKKTHTYFFNDVYIDENGNETGDSIDLTPCDYLLDDVQQWDWEKIFEDEIAIQTYGE